MKEVPHGPHIQKQFDALEATQSRLGDFCCLFGIYSKETKRHSLENLWMWASHFYIQYTAKDIHHTSLQELDILCNCYFYTTLLLKLMEEKNDHLIQHTVRLLDILKERGGTFRLTEPLKKDFTQYIISSNRSA